MRRPAAALGIVFVTAVLVSACARSTPVRDRPAEPAIGPIPIIAASSEYSRPLDAYLPTADDQLQLARVGFAAENECFKTRGIDARASEPSDLSTVIAQTYRDRVVRSDLFGFYDTDNVLAYGYLRPPGVATAVEIHDPAGVDQADLAACKAAGAMPAAGTDSGSLPGGGPPVPRDDSRYLNAVSAWSKCMVAQGYDYSSPITAQDRGQSNSHQDVATAIADVGCKNSTNLVGVAMAVETAYDQVYIADHETQLTEYVNAVQRALRAGAGH